MNSADRVFLELAALQAVRSQDPSTRVGAALVLDDGQIITGYNNFLFLPHPEAAERQDRYDRVVHAEATALHAVGTGGAHRGTLYCSEEPCVECTKLAIIKGVSRVVFLATTPERRERWRCDAGKSLAAAARLTYVELPREAVGNPA